MASGMKKAFSLVTSARPKATPATTAHRSSRQPFQHAQAVATHIAAMGASSSAKRACANQRGVAIKAKAAATPAQRPWVSETNRWRMNTAAAESAIGPSRWAKTETSIGMAPPRRRSTAPQEIDETNFSSGGCSLL